MSWSLKAAPRMRPKLEPWSKFANWEMECSPIGRRNPNKRLKQSPHRQSEVAAVPKKKALSWHSTYGEISVLEQRLREGRRGRQVRPFCQSADIGQRDYSRPLQRALVDFG